MSHLIRICENTRLEVLAREKSVPVSALKDRGAKMPAPRGFAAALQKRVQAKQTAVIAEIKRMSPSLGALQATADAAVTAEIYEKNGAAALSVLTDQKFFGGSLDDLDAVRSATNLPILRKDFMLTDYQIYEARAHGADCILLIMAALSDEQASGLHDLAVSLGMDVLIEVHDAAELTRALRLPSSLIGINNRNLTTLDIDVTMGLSLRPWPQNRLMIAESGFYDRADIVRYQEAGCYAFLIGTALMRSENPAAALAGLL